jgi:tripartite-type tricarboxylate transporter receptor subunit TctC
MSVGRPGRRRLLRAACGAAPGLLALDGRAQAFPARPIMLVVPFPPGGTTDILAREIAGVMQGRLGVPVVVQNVGGAGGTLGSAQVARAAGDAHVLLLTATHHVINPALLERLPYDTRRDFTPIALIATAPNVLIVNAQFPAQSVGDLIRMARDRPGAIGFASSGVGGANHLSGELFKVMAGVDMMHVPYKGAAPALNDVMAGHVPVMFDGLAAVTPHLSGGKVRALAVTSLRRAPTAPQLPTIDESGVKGFEVLSWFGLYGAAQLPSAALARIAAEVAATMRSPEIEQRFARLGVTRGELSQPEFARFVDDEIDKWGRVIATARIPKQ